MMIATRGNPRRSSLKAETALVGVLLALCSQQAFAGGSLPSGGQFVGGQGSIAGGSNNLTINQSTSHAIIDWRSFSIGSGNSVQFNNGNGATLNKVTGPGMSQIDGRLGATGSVYLINPQGIVIGPNGKVVTNGSFVASTRDVSDSAFMGGSGFTASGNSAGDVVNAGTITSKNGDAILVGRSVKNTGAIAAPNGTAALAAGNQILLRPVGSDPRISVSGGNGNVTNAGAISAAQAQLTAAGGNVYAIAGNNGGINATGTAVINGHVWLTAGGTAHVSGNVSAAGDGAQVTIGGGNVSLDAASVSAKGPASGGTIAVGGWSSTSVTADKATVLDASAGSHGNGGRVAVIGQTTRFNGTALARGGAQSGNGGTIETSGHQLDVTGATIDTTAAHGLTGAWTLDPYNVTISSATTASGSLSSGVFTPSGNDSVLSVSDLEAALATTNVVVTTGASGSQTGDITVASPLTWSANTLTLDAYHSININATVAATGTAALALTTNDGGSGGDLYFNNGNITFASTSQSLSINGNTYTLLGSMSDVQNLNSDGTGHYALAKSLDASSTTGWIPIGTDGAGNIADHGSYNGFSGTFEGLGNTISNLSVAAGSNNYAGLFGYSQGTIRDFGLLGGSVSGGQYVGALVGENIGTIQNVHATSPVSGSSVVGGLVGFNIGGTGGTAAITNSYAAGDVTTSNTVGGGLIGYNSGTVSDSYATGDVISGASNLGGFAGVNQGTITSSYATGNVGGTSGGTYYPYIGGFVGTNQSTGSISNSYATGTVVGGGFVGGFVGLNSATIQSSYANSQVTSGDHGIGGFVGENISGGNISSSHASGTVSGSAVVGGFAGSNADTINTSYATVSVSGGADTGGLVGFNSGTISTSYATGTTSGTMGPAGGDLGGLVGLNTGSIDTSYAKGAVSGNKYNGGLVGENIGTISSSYFDTDTTGVSSHYGVAGTVDASGVTGLTNTQMMTSSSYSGWTFGTTGGGSGWIIVDTDSTLNNASGATGGTTPMLLSEYSTSIVNAHQLQLIQLAPYASYTLGADIDASGTAGGDVWNASSGFAPIWYFNGSFDGQNHTISGLHINQPTRSEIGLFGTSYGSISNVSLSGEAVTGNGNVGGLIGLANSGTITNASVSGTVNGQTFVGGLVGQNYATVTGSHAGGTVSGSTSQAGGLIGYNIASVSNSYATASVSGGETLGGLVGENLRDLTNVYATGSVNGVYQVGGLIGDNAGASISGAHATGAVNGSGFYAGGLIGENEGGAISDSYAVGATTGRDNVGGLIGINDNASVTRTYSTGAVASNYSGSMNLGGLVGSGNGTVSASYWNTSTSGQSTSVGGGTGLTTTQMMNSANFSGWTFGSTPGASGWVIVDTDGTLNNASGAAGGTTPMLLTEYSTTIANAHQLQLMELAPTASYTLASDIDASGTSGSDVWNASSGFVPVGNSTTPFSGTFDGKHYTISGLYINQSVGNLVGLFGDASGTIGNVALTGASVTGPVEVGALAGESDGSITNASSAGAVNASSYAGGLVGINKGTITSSHAGGTASGGSIGQAGGLVGDNYSTISNSYATTSVTGFESTGGLVGWNSGTLVDVYATGAVTGRQFIGGLVGNSDPGATITNSYATGAVGGSNASYVGGLAGVGRNISGSYATGTVTGNSVVGGLVGNNDGVITDSYATGAVIANSYAGGLIAQNDGSVASSYSTGAVAATSNAGGLLALNYGTVSNSYWNTQTSGQSTSAGGTGLTTSQLQGSLPSGFSSSTWGTGSGLYPYFLWQYPASGGTPQAVYGTAYNNFGGLLASTRSAPVTITALIDGNNIGTAATGTNGYYYILAAPNTLSASGSQGYAYISSNPTGGTYWRGAVYSQDITGPTAEMDPWMGGQHLISGRSTMSQVLAGLNTAVGSQNNTGMYYTASGGFVPNTGTYITLTSPSFSFDSSFSTGTADLFLQSSGSVTETGGTITAYILSLQNGGNYNLTGNNHVDILAAPNVSSLSFTDAQALTVGTPIFSNGYVSSPGSIALQTTSGGIDIERPITNTSATGLLSLNSAAGISQSSTGTITATRLAGRSTGSTALNAANSVDLLYGFNANGFSFTNDKTLVVLGAVNSGSGSLSLSTLHSGEDLSFYAPLTSGPDGFMILNSAGSIGQTASGTLNATRLTGASGASTVLTAANRVTLLYGFASNGFSLTDANTLLVLGAVNSGTGNLTLTTTGANADLDFYAPLTSSPDGFMILNAGGSIGQSASGTLNATRLTGASGGSTALSAANQVTLLYGFAANGFSLTDANSLLVIGAVNSGNGSLTLTTTNANADLSFYAPLTSGPDGFMILDSAGSIGQAGSGILNAVRLTGRSAQNTSLNAGNYVTALYGFHANGFSLTNAQNLMVLGSVDSGNGGLSLVTQGVGNNISLYAPVTAMSDFLSLNSSGTITEYNGGSLNASRLDGKSVGATDLEGTNNVFLLYNFSAPGFWLTDNRSLIVLGAVNTGSGPLDLTTMGSGNYMTIYGTLTTSGTMRLVSDDAITETSTGAIIANLLTVQAGTGITLTASGNHITTLGTHTTRSGPNSVRQ